MRAVSATHSPVSSSTYLELLEDRDQVTHLSTLSTQNQAQMKSVGWMQWMTMNKREILFAYLFLSLLADSDQYLPPSSRQSNPLIRVHNHYFKHTSMRKFS